jgi:hypothetical protein
VQSIAPGPDDPRRRFQITHPFHPLRGQEFESVTFRHNWGEDRVYFHDQSGKLAAVPVSWTDYLPPDPFVAVSAGRSLFRFEDLIKLAELLVRLQS